MIRRLIAVVVLSALALGGCAGGSSFTATSPPPDTSADAWFVASPERVRNAVARAMEEQGFALMTDPDTGAILRGTKPQLVADGRPVEQMPIYVLRARVTKEGNTHVRATVSPECPVCDGVTEFEWEYPTDLLRDVLGRTRALLGEGTARLSYPPRYRPPIRRRPPWRP